MRHILEAGNALEVADVLTHHLPKDVHSTAKSLYRALAWVSVETARRKGQHPSITEGLVFLPLEQLAAAVGISRITAWRYLGQLRALGLVDHRTHKGSLRGETRSSGTVWRVRLTPDRGCKARLRYDDLKHVWRDLDADARAGRTSYRLLKHTKALETESLRFISLLQWHVKPTTQADPVALVCFSNKRAELERVLDVTSSTKAQRGQAVDLAAQALALALRDQQSLGWYRKLLWQLLRRHDSTGQDHSYQVFLAAQRAAVDAQEWSGLRRPGGLFQSRLRAAEWFAEMMGAPPTRVASRPAQA